MDRDFYAVMCLDRDATAQDIEDRWRAMRVVLHPDRNPPDKRDQMTAVYQAWDEAYRVLSTRREEYDSRPQAGEMAEALRWYQSRNRALQSQSNALHQRVHELTEEVHALADSVERAHPAATGHLYAGLDVQPRTMRTGGRYEIEGLVVDIPRGSQPGTILRLPGEGLQRPEGGYGDLFLQLGQTETATKPGCWAALGQGVMALFFVFIGLVVLVLIGVI